MINTKEIKELRDKTGAGLFECKEAINFCLEHPDCTPIGYLKAKGLAVYYKGSFLEKVRWMSESEDK